MLCDYGLLHLHSDERENHGNRQPSLFLNCWLLSGGLPTLLGLQQCNTKLKYGRDSLGKLITSLINLKLDQILNLLNLNLPLNLGHKITPKNIKLKEEFLGNINF